MKASQSLTNEQLVELFRRAATIRSFDTRADRLIRSGRMTAIYYNPKGQEIIPCAISLNLSDDDYICTTYRGLHDSLAKGLPLRDCWAELQGRVSGPCKGKGGPMHITYPSKGIMLTTGIVGATLPIANGLAWASQLDGSSRVTIANFGDGASNIGAFHEALNLASVWSLPVVFVCQNNRYGEHTAYANSTKVERIAMRAASYAIPGVTVDGNDPDAMYAAAKEAIQRARDGGGPTLIEAMTYRLLGHNYGDDCHYMDKAERQAAINDDPLPKLRNRLISENIATAEQVEAIERQIEQEMTDAVEFALKEPYPDIQEMKRDVYAHELA